MAERFVGQLEEDRGFRSLIGGWTRQMVRGLENLNFMTTVNAVPSPGMRENIYQDTGVERGYAPQCVLTGLK